MKQITAAIQYAHCIKWTTGKLDVAPHSAYELRSAVVSITESVSFEFDSNEYLVEFAGQRIGWGYSAYEALGDAEYWLMDQSRRKAMEQTRISINFATAKE